MHHSCPCMLQRHQAAAAASQAVTEWTALLQQLTDSPVASPADGQVVVTNTIQYAQNLEEQQRHAFSDLASKDEALCDAEHKLGKLCLILVSCIRCVWNKLKTMGCPRHFFVAWIDTDKFAQVHGDILSRDRPLDCEQSGFNVKQKVATVR